jgi:epoxyqueuosine reductase
MTSSNLAAQLEERGYKGRAVPFQHLYDLQEGIKGHYEQGLIEKGLYQEYLSPFTFDIPTSWPDARSLIVVAVPHPQFQIVFTWRGKQTPLLMPPTYVHGERIDSKVQDVLAEILEPEGYRVARAVLPKKLLAVRSGLATYGRNNITYVPGMGSFYRLAAFYSDLPCQKDSWREAQMMAACENCSACLRNCPTGAISADRFLLHAERCIVYHNEQPGDVPFPRWMDPSWHNCLIGCMRCQNVCPQDKELWQWVEEGAEFSEQETALLLEGGPLEQLPAATMEKLEHADLARHAGPLPRNLSVLLSQQC